MANLVTGNATASKSNGFTVPVHLQARPSRCLALWVLCVHALSFSSLFFLPLFSGAVLLIGIGVLLHGFVQWRKVRQTPPALTLLNDAFMLEDGEFAELVPGSRVLQGLVILRIREIGSRRIQQHVFCADSFSPERFQLLQVRLRYLIEREEMPV